MEPPRCCCYSNLLLWCSVRRILLLPPFSPLAHLLPLSLKVEHHIEFNPKSQYHESMSEWKQIQTKCGGVWQTCVSTAGIFSLTFGQQQQFYCIPPNRNCNFCHSLCYSLDLQKRCGQTLNDYTPMTDVEELPLMYLISWFTVNLPLDRHFSFISLCLSDP